MTDADPQLVTAVDLEQHFGTNLRWFIAEAEAGALPATKVGKQWMFSLTAVMAALADRAQQTTVPSLLSLEDMAARLKVLKPWLKQEADCGRVPCLIAGGGYLFNPAAVEAALSELAASGRAKVIPKDELVSAEEAARALNVKASVIKKLARHQEITSVKVGLDRRYSLREIELVLLAHAKDPTLAPSRHVRDRARGQLWTADQIAEKIGPAHKRTISRALKRYAEDGLLEYWSLSRGRGKPTLLFEFTAAERVAKRHIFVDTMGRVNLDPPDTVSEGVAGGQ